MTLQSVLPIFTSIFRKKKIVNKKINKHTCIINIYIFCYPYLKHKFTFLSMNSKVILPIKMKQRCSSTIIIQTGSTLHISIFTRLISKYVTVFTGFYATKLIVSKGDIYKPKQPDPFSVLIVYLYQ